MTATLGAPVARLEGAAKVTGEARFAFEYAVDDVAYAWPVQSPVAKGVVVGVDEQPDVAGVLAVLWQGNVRRLKAVDDTELGLMQSADISYQGQVIALVIADSLEAAQEGARVLAIEVTAAPHDVLLRADHPGLYTPEVVNPKFPAVSIVGEPDDALAKADVSIDHVYTTPALHNSPMEPHATIAVWSDGALTLYDSNQGPSATADVIAKIFDLEAGKVRVISEHVGGGFGSKGSPRPNVVLTALAAWHLGRPVKLAISRQAMFTLVGYRTPTIQRIRLGATRDGHLTAIAHDVVEQSSTLFEFAEQTAVCTRHMYAAPNRRTAHQLVRLDVPTPRWMRAPGECPGMYALESAMDELAVELAIDPVELRIRNEPEVEPESGTPFSSRHYVECLRRGAELFGWADRDPAPGARHAGEWLTGTGVAGATYPAMVMPSTATVRAEADGRFTVSTAAIDIGTGGRTVIVQIAAVCLGVDLDVIDVEIGDSRLPKASIAGGSSGTGSWGWAIDLACRDLRAAIDRSHGEIPPEGLLGKGDSTDAVAKRESDGKHAFGAHFAEVKVSRVTGETRVSRLLGVYAAGQIVNARTARSQLIGGMTMGLGMALHEEGVLDASTGDQVNHDFAEYHIAAHADVPEIEVEWLAEADSELNPLGTKGIGELGIVGTAAAITNAVYHATGTRIRDLPVRLDKILCAEDV
jgi:xanthine dehydrogenase YagR molybdenum-binding subunit